MGGLWHHLNDFWHWLPGVSRSPRHIYIYLALGVGGLSALSPLSWRATRLFATYIHEAGHAVFAFATGRKVLSIRLEADASGSTRHAGVKGSFLSRFLTTLAGYPAPAALGYLMILGLSSGHARFVVTGFYALSFILAFFQHSLRGWAVTLSILVVCTILVALSPLVMSISLYCVSGYLLMASPRTIIELHQVHRQMKKFDVAKEERHSDAQSLAELTGIGAVLWEIVFMVLCLTAVYYSFTLLHR